MSKHCIKTHNIKILENFADEVLSGNKTFEVRLNDRGYQKGDLVTFNCVLHPIEKLTYEITYVLSGWGIKKDYVAFGIKKKEI